MTSKMPFDWQKDLALLTLVARLPEGADRAPSLGVNTLQEFVAHARANPGKVSYGSAGTGTVTHLAAELLKSEAKINILHVPYRGAAPAVNDLLGNHVQMIVADAPVLLPHILAGKIKALAVTSATRSTALPDVRPRRRRPAMAPCCRTTGMACPLRLVCRPISSTNCKRPRSRRSPRPNSSTRSRARTPLRRRQRRPNRRLREGRAGQVGPGRHRHRRQARVKRIR